MNALTYRLRLLEPLLVSQAQSGEENSSIGLLYAPGSALRGALIARYLRKYPTADLAGDARARRLFFDGAVCFLNAYPWRDGRRMLPTPASWFMEKDQADKDDPDITDLAAAPDAEPEQPKAVKPRFCTSANEPMLYTPALTGSVHITLVKGEEKNKVYRYDALPPGELLGGAIVADNPADLDLLLELLCEGDLILGGSHLAGYGRARVEDAKIVEDWEEYSSGDGPESGAIIVTLLSDAICRGADGQVNGDLAAALGAPTLQPERAYHERNVVGGYNRKWSLPLPQAWALPAGSVFVYAKGAFDLEQLRAAAASGVGERRAEGFGRIAINWQGAEEQFTGSKSEADESTGAKVTLSAESRALAGRMAERRFRLLLEQRLAAAVNTASFGGALPNNAQLSRVRAVAQQALATAQKQAQGIAPGEGETPAPPLQPVLDHLSDLKKEARGQFERARIGSTPMLAWLEARATTCDAQTEILKQPDFPVVGGVTAELTPALRAEYTARLIDAVMKKATVENQSRKEVRR